MTENIKIEDKREDKRNVSVADLALTGMNRLVYVKEISASDLPKELTQNLDQNTPLYAICAADGTPMSIVDNRDVAFSGARENNFEPVSVH